MLSKDLAFLIVGGVLLIVSAILLTGRDAGTFAKSPWFENGRLKTPHKIGVAVGAIIIAAFWGHSLFVVLGW
jgi:hypothetical protein